MGEIGYNENTVFLVWKIPDDNVFGEDVFSERGIYPSGELCGIFEKREDAVEAVEMLRAKSPSDRFGSNQDPMENSMDEAPYAFTISERPVS